MNKKIKRLAFDFFFQTNNMAEAIPSTSTEVAEDTSSVKQESKAENEPAKPPKQYFQCSTCSLREKFDHFTTRPPKMKHFEFTENCYVMVDPFVPPNRGEYLVLGAHCVKCNRTVCRDSSCSFYFGGTYCVKCAKECARTFPKAVQEKLNRIVSN